MNLYKQKLNTRTGQFNLVPSNSVLTWKPAVDTEASLPTEGNVLNDARMVNDTHHLYVWDGTAWQNQGDIIDLTWAAISGKPTSLVTDIDDAVTKRHTQNTDIALRTDKLTVDALGNTEIQGSFNLPNDQAIKFGGGILIKRWETNKSIAIGKTAGADKLNCYYFGDNAGLNNSGVSIVAMGYEAGKSNSGDYVTVIGYNAGNGNTGLDLIALGKRAGYQNTGTFSIGIGTEASRQQSGTYAVGIGWHSLEINSGNYAIGIGYYAGQQNNKEYLVAIGYEAGHINTGTYELAIGYRAGKSNSGNYLIAVGKEAAQSNSGVDLIAIGNESAKLNSGINIVAIGHEAGNANSGDNCVFLGYEAGKNNNLANQFIVIQENINSNPLIQGNFSTGYVGIGTASPTSKLQVTGLPVYADNAAAKIGGLTDGAFYRTGDLLKVVN